MVHSGLSRLTRAVCAVASVLAVACGPTRLTLPTDAGKPSVTGSLSARPPREAGVTTEVTRQEAARIADTCTPHRGCRYPQ